MNFRAAICQRTAEVIRLIDGCFAARPSTGEWFFFSMEAADESGYYCIPVESFASSPEAFDRWMVHLNQKRWFVPQQFADFLSRYPLEIGASRSM